MIDIPKSLIRAIKDGLERPSELERYLRSLPMDDVISGFAELILVADDYMRRPQISITEAEWETIRDLFKIKGQRIKSDGTVVEETRGRKKK